MREHMMSQPTTKYLNFSEWEQIDRRRREVYSEKMQYERARRANYYKRQRVLGAALILAGVLALLIASVNAFRVMQGVAAVIAVVGVYVLLTKHMVLIDEYYYECMDKLNLF